MARYFPVFLKFLSNIADFCMIVQNTVQHDSRAAAVSFRDTSLGFYSVNFHLAGSQPASNRDHPVPRMIGGILLGSYQRRTAAKIIAIGLGVLSSHVQLEKGVQLLA